MDSFEVLPPFALPLASLTAIPDRVTASGVGQKWVPRLVQDGRGQITPAGGIITPTPPRISPRRGHALVCGGVRLGSHDIGC